MARLVDEAVAAGRAESRDDLVVAALEREIRQWRRDERWAAHRAALLATPTLKLGELATRRGESESATYRWLASHRANGTLVAIPAGDELDALLIPEFQFDESGAPIDVVMDANAALAASRVYEHWSMWAWWHSRTSYLGGESPINLIHINQDRVITAARRMSAPIRDG